MAFLDSIGKLKPMTREEIEREQLRLAKRTQEQRGRKIDSLPAGLALLVDSLTDAYDQYQTGRSSDANRQFGADLLARAVGGQSQAYTPSPTAPTAGAPAPSQAQDMILANESRNVPEDIRSGIASTAQALGISPVDLATVISYETGGTFDPTKSGPTTQWGQHRGLIQFGEPQAKQYGVDWNNPIGSQLGPDGAVAKYLRDRGVKPGMGLLDIYSTVNAGAPGLYDRSDANNGGAPGTVADKVNTQMAGHRQRAMAMFGEQAGQRPELQQAPAQGGMPVPPNPVQNLPGQGGQPVADPQQLLQQTPAVYQSTRGQDPRNAVIAAGQGMGQPAPATPPQVIPAPPQAGVQQALAQQPQQAAQGVSQQELMAALSSGRLDPQQEQIVTMLIKQQQARDNATREQQMQRDQFTWEQQQRQRDPAYQAQLAVAQRNAEDARTGMTPEMRNLNARADAAGLRQGSPERQQFMMTGGRGPMVQVNTGDNSDKFREESDKAAATRLGGYIESGNTAQAQLADMQTLAELAKGFTPGAGAQFIQKAAPVLQAIGINPEGMSDIQAFEAIVSRMTPQMRQVGSGSSSDLDVRMFARGLPNLGNTPEGNEIINLTFQSIAQNKVQAAEIASRAYLPKDQGGITWQQAEKQIRELPNPFQAFKEYQKARKEGNAAPSPGDIRKGYRFVGGNPADPNSWQKVQ